VRFKQRTPVVLRSRGWLTTDSPGDSHGFHLKINETDHVVDVDDDTPLLRVICDEQATVFPGDAVVICFDDAHGRLQRNRRSAVGISSPLVRPGKANDQKP
jgi:hypothetical protein